MEVTSAMLQPAPATVAFCLLSYRPDHPSGIERSIAALIEGLRQLGHTPLILAAGPAQDGDDAEPGLIRLESVRLPRPAINKDVLDALANPAAVRAEVQEVLQRHHVDAACWGDTLWGLGYLGAAPPGTRTALMVHKIRPAGEERWLQALKAADVVCPASDYLLEEAIAAGRDTSNWHVVLNALLMPPAPPPIGERQRLRSQGPIRIVSRAEPEKGLPQLLEAMPATWSRPVELVLAEADFEFWPGMQTEVMDACRQAAARRPDVITLLPALGWRQVPAFLGQAAATIISSIEPETFCFTAAEALSAGTPVITHDIGNVPLLAGPAGRCVPLEQGAAALWEATANLLDDDDAYLQASQAACDRITRYTAKASARALLDAVLPDLHRR
ncbi:glycosyltransferase family 4 protein [Nonomuraea sp. NPDC049695]|uniref:glycosyltransferase family 4 protein n=1 Tax=Nonomuraea sp. NPDC049695 TaxID=3154734 RepID=UPI003424A961